MRIVVVGGTGHIGTYLCPRLVEAGHQVISISRGMQAPFQHRVAWTSIQRLAADRDAEDAAGVFGSRILDLHPDAVIDLILLRAPQRATACRRAARFGAPFTALWHALGAWRQYRSAGS